MGRVPVLRFAGPAWSGFGTVAALFSVFLYVALLSSHIVSQASSHLSIQTQAGDAQTALAGDNCHEPDGTPGKSDRKPAAPSKKCPLCTGYGVLGLAIAAAPASLSAKQFVAERLAYSYNTRAFHSGEWRSSQPRGPPTATT